MGCSFLLLSSFFCQTSKLVISPLQKSIEFPVSNNYLAICEYWALVYTFPVLSGQYVYLILCTIPKIYNLVLFKTHASTVYTDFQLQWIIPDWWYSYFHFFCKYFYFCFSFLGGENLHEFYRFVCCASYDLLGSLTAMLSHILFQPANMRHSVPSVKHD